MIGWQLLIWLALLVALIVFVIGRSREGGALILAYFLSFSLIHVPGALAYLDPNSVMTDREETELGFTATLIGMAAFIGGAIITGWFQRRRLVGEVAISSEARQRFEQAGLRMIVVGSVVYFFILPIAGRVASLTALVSPLASLLLLGLWLRLYAALVFHSFGQSLGFFLLLPLLPLSTLVSGGFIGYGVSWVLSIVSFLFVVAHRRIWFFLLAPAVTYFGLSLFVTYMGERDAIRDVVWHQQSGFDSRLERVSGIVTNFEFLDLGNVSHLAALDGRLNQNVLVGATVQRHEDGVLDLSYGATVAPWLLIPRAIWPDKPEVGGGGQLVSEVTGITFAESTSVGAGQVLEFYANFGWSGIVIGFAVLGAILLRLDRGIMQSLVSRDFQSLVKCTLPGLALLQPGGNLLEIFVSVIAAILVSHAIGVLMSRHRQTRVPQHQSEFVVKSAR